MKKNLILMTEKMNTRLPITFKGGNKDYPSSFQKIIVQGRYQNESTLLVQNQIRHGRVGFEIFTPLKIANDNKLLLVDRGWVAQLSQGQLPQIDTVSDEQTISGYVKWMDEYHFILGKNIFDEASKPWVAQKVDLQELSRLSHHSFYPFVMRLNPNASNGYLREWNLTSLSPERHLGYALQWFVMALVLLIAYMLFAINEIKKRGASDVG